MAPPLWTSTAGREDDGNHVEADADIVYHPIRAEGASNRPQESQDGSAAVSGVANGHHENGSAMVAGGSLSNGRRPQERIVTVNGMEFHVYGNASGLELLSLSDREEPLNLPDSDEEEEEERRRVEAERAIFEANQAHEARRAAPLPEEHRTRILNAMKAIDLGGFRPSWADSIPEDQWLNKFTSKGSSSTS